MDSNSTTLLINIDKDLKEEFKKTCKVMGNITMTDVCVSYIKQFVKKSKSTK